MIFRFTRRFHSRFHHRESHHHTRVFLVVGRAVHELKHNRRLKMSISNQVGAAPVNLKLVFTDQNGHPMRAAVVADAAPSWSNTNAAAETLSASSDGLSASATAVAEGADEIDVTAVVGGKSFSAALAVTVNPEAQVLSGIQIVTV